MLGIKAGEDAYKSDTGVRLFDRIGRKLERLYGEHQVSAVVPYSRATMGLLARGQFDGETARQYRDSLGETPKLAGAVMRDMLGQWLRRERAPVLEDHPPLTLPQHRARDRARDREPARMQADSPARAGLGKRKREEIEERRVRQRIDNGETAALPPPAVRMPGNNRAAPGRQKQ